MKIALRKGAATDATFLQRVFVKLIEWRLASEYSHGGVVIDGDLYHVNAIHGLHKINAGDWDPEKWVLIDVADERDEFVKSRFEALKDFVEYDVLGIFAYVISKDLNNIKELYCFEWIWYCLTGELPKKRITPDSFYELIAKKGVGDASK